MVDNTQLWKTEDVFEALQFFAQCSISSNERSRIPPSKTILISVSQIRGEQGRRMDQKSAPCSAKGEGTDHNLKENPRVNGRQPSAGKFKNWMRMTISEKKIQVNLVMRIRDKFISPVGEINFRPSGRSVPWAFSVSLSPCLWHQRFSGHGLSAQEGGSASRVQRRGNSSGGWRWSGSHKNERARNPAHKLAANKRR